jgi:hypothetical protein
MHLTVEHAIQAATGLLTIGVMWGVLRATVRGLEGKVDLHVANTQQWRESLDSRVQDLTNILLSKR